MKQLIITLFALCLPACNTPSAKQTKTQPLVSQKNLPQKTDRLFVIGNFNNDAIADTVYELCYSSLTHAPVQTLQIDMNDNITNNVDSIIKQKPITKLYATITGADTFLVSNHTQQQGLYYLINLGDLDGDHADEIGYIINYADYSNLNKFYILSLKNNKFTPLFNFPINEMLSFLPEDMIDSNAIIKPLPPNSIKYKFYSDSATIELGTYTFK